MRTLQYAGLWRALSVLILILVLIAALAPAFWFFDDKPDALDWLEHADKLFHAGTFLLLAVWFAGLSEKSAWWRVALGLLLFGFALEFFQFQTNYRTADWLDIAANTAGIIAGLAIAAAGLGSWALRFEDWYSRRHQN